MTELFLPSELVCGIPIDNVGVATPGSAVEDMCVGGEDFTANDTSPQQLSLIRACTAAALNMSVTAEAGGDCGLEFPGLMDAYQVCCVDLCNSGSAGQDISETLCIETIDAFNNSADTISCGGPIEPPFPFCPGLGGNGFNAEPDACSEATGNGFVNPGRNLGPPKR